MFFLANFNSTYFALYVLLLALREGFPGGSLLKDPPVKARDSGLILGLGRSPGGGNGNPLQYSCLGNSMDRGAWRDTVHGVAKSHTTELEHKEVKLAANPGLLVSRFVDCNLVLQVSPSYLCHLKAHQTATVHPAFLCCLCSFSDSESAELSVPAALFLDALNIK